LADIIENTERIERYLHGMDRATFASSDMTRDAVERCLERVCEAAHRLGEDAVRLMPGQPWAEIRGMGNRLRHAYDRISLDVIWNAIRYDLPGLSEDARKALATIGADGQAATGSLNGDE
jgi:uncharacterized protein with HEPN domain